MNKLDEMAAAIRNETRRDRIGVTWQDVDDYTKDRYRKIARAALAAIRVPTSRAIELGHVVQNDPGIMWRVMVDDIASESTWTKVLADVRDYRASLQARIPQVDGDLHDRWVDSLQAMSSAALDWSLTAYEAVRDRASVRRHINAIRVEQGRRVGPALSRHARDEAARAWPNA